MNRARGDQTFMRTSAGADRAADPLVPGTRLGAWAVEAPIAAGGMGQVYRGRRADGAYEQAVAIKLIHDRARERVARFAAERQRLAEMDHPGIARIIDGGTHADGRPWMAMELVEGAPIMPQAMGLSRDARLRLFIDLCAAVAHAHGRLVLHRDLKSANVLLDANGAVRLIDFGISALAENEEAASSAYTPATAAPEQMRGEAPSVQTDVFALGCILHELLTGSVPGRDERDGALLDRAGIGDADLQAIVTRATAREPADRYPSAQALADDVLAVLEHRPVAARQGGAGYRVGRFVRRFPVASGLAAAFVAALVSGIVVSLTYARQARAEADRAQAELARAEFFLERSETLNRAQNAYADLLRRLTGDSEADLERESRNLMERWREAHDNRAINPAQAAALSYAIGTHFAFRRDHERAVAVLEPWIREGYGPNGLRHLASVHLASNYGVLGRRDDARALLQSLDAEMESGFDRHSISHVQVVQDLAWLGDQQEGFRRAQEVTLAALANETDPHDRSALFNFLGHARLNLRDRTGATEAYRQSVAVAEADPLADPANLSTSRVNLAAMELYIADNPQAALQQIAIVLGPMRDAIGENSFTGLAHMIRGEAALAQGDVATAVRETGEGLALTEKYAGLDGGSWINAAPAHVAALVAAGRTREARRLVDRLEALLTERGYPLFMAEISRARLEAAAGRPDEARRLLAAARTHTAGLERGLPHAWRLAQAEAFVAARGNATGGQGAASR